MYISLTAFSGKTDHQEISSVYHRVIN